MLLWTCLVSGAVGCPNPIGYSSTRMGAIVWMSEISAGLRDARPGERCAGRRATVEVTTGKLLAEVPLDMVQLAEDVDWSNGHAAIKLVVDWDLAALLR